MYIAEIKGNTIVKIDHYRHWFKNVPSDETLARRGFKKVNKFLPHNNLTQKLQGTTPFVDGDFVTTVEVVNLSADEITANKVSSLAQIRKKRNELLNSTDWTQISDSTANKSAYAVYRTELRNVPATIGSADPRTWSDWPSVSLDGSSASGV
jgi:ferritin-like metal-binding protein YciE|tara:strand:- start:1864 stop:2319 length:456 start_codon:yes stop_codon:yes gene_type:complete